MGIAALTNHFNLGSCNANDGIVIKILCSSLINVVYDTFTRTFLYRLDLYLFINECLFLKTSHHMHMEIYWSFRENVWRKFKNLTYTAINNYLPALLFVLGP